MIDKNKIIKLGTFFSGIGAPEKALTNLVKENVIKGYELEFFSEIDKNAIKSYCAIHNVSENLNLGDITKIKGEQLPYCDMWIGGFPCQDISVAGKMQGFNLESATRSSLGWEMIRLLKEVEKKPQVVIFENVAAITSDRYSKTLNMFKTDLTDLGYTLYEKVLSATDYKIPQIRKRYFLVAILDNSIDFEFPEKEELKFKIKDFLDKNVAEKYYLTNDKYKIVDNKIMFLNKNNPEIKYVIDINRYFVGGICGEDLHTTYHQSARLYSDNGNIGTLTANNTSYNCKIVVGEEG